MKKIIRILILLITLLGITLPQSRTTQASKAAARLALRPSQSKQTSPPKPVGAEDEDWIIECVDCPKQFDYLYHRSLRLDADGHPHITYGGDHLYYTKYDGVFWKTEIVDDSPQVGNRAAIELAQDDTPHIIYSDSINISVKYAYHDNSGWHTQTIDTDSICGSLSLDQDGIPHATYSKNGNLIYAYLSKTDWITHTLDVEAGCSSIALDRNGQPHISYISWNNELKYANKNDAIWSKSTIDTDVEGSTESTLRLDQASYAHISYTRYQMYGSDLMYAYQNNAGWHISKVKNYPKTATPSLTLDNQNQPHISYAEEYTKPDGSGWFSQTADSECVIHSSLSLDNAGKPHIICLTNYPDARLRYSSQHSDEWHSITLDKADYVIEDNSLTLDQIGYPHTSYYLNERELRFSSLEGSTWRSRTVDRGQGLFGSTDLEFDRNGHPHLSYFVSGMDQLNLNFASLTNSQWLTQTVVNGWDIEPYHSMALDRDGNPHISFHQSSEIIYTNLKQSIWISQTLASVIDVDNPALSLVIDRAGYPHISYHYTNYDNEISALIYTFMTSSGWKTQTVDSGNVWQVEVGLYPSLVIDTDGQPHIAYLTNHINEQNNEDGIPVYRLYYATLDATGWQTQTVDDAGSSPISLALDSQGQPHISYQGRYPKYDIKYASLDDSDWIIHSVFSNSSFSSGSSSIALDRDSYPHISFNAYGDLFYAYLAPPYRLTIWPTVYQHYSLPGSTATYSLQVSNRGLEQDTYQVSITGAGWTTSPPDSLGPLNSTESTTLDIQVTIPPTATLGSSDTATITLTSQNDPSVTGSATLTTYAAITTYLPIVAK